MPRELRILLLPRGWGCGTEPCPESRAPEPCPVGLSPVPCPALGPAQQVALPPRPAPPGGGFLDPEPRPRGAAAMDLRAELRAELLKSIWYAFTALDVEKSGKVSKSQLKVSPGGGAAGRGCSDPPRFRAGIVKRSDQ